MTCSGKRCALARSSLTSSQVSEPNAPSPAPGRKAQGRNLGRSAGAPTAGRGMRAVRARQAERIVFLDPATPRVRNAAPEGRVTAAAALGPVFPAGSAEVRRAGAGNKGAERGGERVGRGRAPGRLPEDPGGRKPKCHLNSTQGAGAWDQSALLAITAGARPTSYGRVGCEGDRSLVPCVPAPGPSRPQPCLALGGEIQNERQER
ncbi:uncharacterized protein LOC134738429 [Pongo pygmaeus]|uniref:uncharacterized protein LOC134738429 n=1 Tax=Pongo pygmaeus TaxID=9600 RepID=UPI00300D7B71